MITGLPGMMTHGAPFQDGVVVIGLAAERVLQSGDEIAIPVDRTSLCRSDESISLK